MVDTEFSEAEQKLLDALQRIGVQLIGLLRDLKAARKEKED